MLEEEVTTLRARGSLLRLDEVVTLLDEVVREVPPVEFVTLPAYELLG
jgi:hypothetical protein